MNKIFQTFCIALVVSLGVNGPLWAQTAKEPAINVFQEPLGLGLGKAAVPIVVEDEDIANTLAGAHPVEQERYRFQYQSHYGVPLGYAVTRTKDAPANSSDSEKIYLWADGSMGAQPEDDRIASPVDAEGRPLWLDGPAGSRALQKMVLSLFRDGRTADLDRLFEDWSASRIRTADGTWRLEAFQKGIASQLRSGVDWRETFGFISNWRKTAPQSRAAALTEVIFWLENAWAARGNGFQDTVTPEGNHEFGQKLLAAEYVLDNIKPLAESSPLWGSLYVEAATGLNQPKDELMTLFRTAVGREKNYLPLYSAAAFGLSPKWAGDWGRVDELIRSAAEATRDSAGNEFYTRLYIFIADNYRSNFNLFTDTKAKWPEMKHGFEDMIRNFPHSGANLNLYAAYACMAGDGDTFKLLRLRLGAQADPLLLPRNHSLDLCDHRFGG